MLKTNIDAANSTDTQVRAYEIWAHFYDYLYSWFLHPAHRRIGEAASAAGKDILEVGVGTGLMLSHYSSNTCVTGIDLSADMLAKACEKLPKLPHVRNLRQMDATKLDFPDAVFDVVVIPFVITLIPKPLAALDEAYRVLRPGGRLIIASKMASDRKWLRDIETMLNPFFNRIGWSSSFPRQKIESWLENCPALALSDTTVLPPVGMFEMLCITKAER